MKNTIQITLLITTLLASQPLGAMNDHSDFSDYYVDIDEDAYYNLIFDLELPPIETLPSTIDEAIAQASALPICTTTDKNNDADNTHEEKTDTYAHEEYDHFLNNNNNSLLINAIRGHQSSPLSNNPAAKKKQPHNTTYQFTEYQFIEEKLSIKRSGTYKQELKEKKDAISPKKNLKKKHLCSYRDSSTSKKCGKSFTHKRYLTQHIRTHTGEKPYQCTKDGCCKRFTQIAHLTTHLATHTGEKPFKCTFEGCNQAFTKNGHLTTHMILHSGERPFPCPIHECGKTFTQRAHLTTHMTTHTGEKSYKCTTDGCAKTFARKDNLTRHIKTVHSKKK